MYNLGDDNELDRLSREAAGRYDPPGNTHWQALSEELDKIMPQEKKKRRFPFWWILPGLLAGGAITYGIIKKDGNSSASIERNIPAVSTAKTNEQATLPDNNDQPTKQTITTTDTKTEKPAEEKVAIATPQIKESATALLKTGKPGAKILLFKKARNTVTLNSHILASKSIDKVVAESTPVQLSQLSVAIPEISSTAEQTLIATEQKKVTKETGQPQQPVNTAPAKTEKEPVAEEYPVKEDIKKANLKNRLPARGKGWSFGLLTGIDKSTVKFKYGYSPGFNLGLELAYHFNDKWAVRTGGIFTQKNYKLAGEDFTAPKGTPISYYKLDRVDGSCHMWEVPLLVSYTLRTRGNKSIRLNTGLSSYFMTHEDYDYYYPYNGVPSSRTASYNSTDTHILSIAHLSAGFENRLSKTISWQIEPYAKIPLGGIGFGSIRLSSFGVNLSVQYRQPAKK